MAKAWQRKPSGPRDPSLQRLRCRAETPRGLPEPLESENMDMKSLVPWRRNSRELTKSEAMDSMPSIFGLHRQMNRLFDDFFRDFDSPLMRGGLDWPAVEVQDDEKETKVVAELPGLEEKDIDLSLRDGVLTIKGEKSRKTDGAIYSERWHGKFTRAIDLGPDVDPDKVRANFDKGVLTVTLQKRPGATTETRKIAINRS
jgi:HSP20 family protein